MQVIQTAAEPPNHGRINLETSGWTRNNRQALVRMVTPNSNGKGRADWRVALASLMAGAVVDTVLGGLSG